MATWPTNIKSFGTPHQDYTENIMAAHVNDLQDEAVAVQTNLGAMPHQGLSLLGVSTTFATVKARLDAYIVAIRGHLHTGADGSLKLDQANTHQNADTDAGQTSLHHTLGTGANQAAAGPHTHTNLPQASVTGLTTALTGKSDTTHAHAGTYVVPGPNGLPDGVNKLYRTDVADGYHVRVDYSGPYWVLTGRAPDGSLYGGCKVAQADNASNAGYATSAGSAPASGGTSQYVSDGATGARFDVTGQFYGQSFALHDGVIWTATAAVRGRTIAGYTVRVGSDGSLGSDGGSSRRWKNEITDLDVSVDDLRNLRPVTYRYTDERMAPENQPELPQAGFIAEEIAESFPGAALYDEDGIPDGYEERAMVAGAYKMIRDLYARQEASDLRIADLEAQLESKVA